MKLATWNVNGIRARQSQVQEWIAQERSDVVCLQEIKATTDQIPAALCEMEGYWCYWHGGKGYSGVALQVSQTFAPERPSFSHPTFDYENRIVTVDLTTALGDVTVASIYVPNGGKDFPAKMQFLLAMDAYAASFAASGRLRRGVRGGRPRPRDAGRHERRTDRARCPPEGAQAAGDRPAAGGRRHHR